ncbi:MAG: serine/threonine protein kinase [Acidobacteriaceae bacterium]|nr:serine/threonine protein kinase [Acidobacteriaceae bacterium]
MIPVESSTAAQALGKYEIVRKLSRSMTDVYLANDTEANRPVVLKLIEHSRDDFTQLVIEAERRGAQLQKQLHDIDPRILEVYEYGEQNGYFFVAMQYFEGRTLAEILRAERRIEPKRAARYAAEICSQLKTLHAFVSDVDGRRTAVVHGDVKPSNVQIGANDELRLLDFGIAKVITFTHNLTHHNLGSPSYCSPERISRAQVDPHSDLWAVGITLYEMTSGTPPYQAQSTRKLENLIQSRRPPRALPESCPAPLRAIISKALAAEIERRYPSAEAFESDLRAFEEGRPASVELEPLRAWNSNATIDKHAKPIAVERARGATRVVADKSAARRVKTSRGVIGMGIALLVGVLVGLLIFIPISYYRRFRAASAPLLQRRDYSHESTQNLAADWSLFQALREKLGFLGEYSPIEPVEQAFEANLVASASNILDSFRHSTDGRLADFDWAKARLCLLHALELDPADAKSRGELALCDGYLELGDNPDAQRAAGSATHFREAESYLPRSPDPHLGLARAAIYGSHNIGLALAEFHQAEQSGYRLGPRESEQEADGYLYRAKTDLDHAKNNGAPVAERERWLQAARSDDGRARELYEPLSGFSNVDSDLEQVYAVNAEAAKLEADLHPAPRKPRPAKRSSSSRRWR